MAPRLAGRFGYPEEEPFKVTIHPEKLEDPLHWRKPQRVFVDSMSDLFHPDVPDEFIERVFGVMDQKRKWDLDNNTKFMILTKRPARMMEWVSRWYSGKHAAEAFRLSNVWLGVSVEDQATADERIPLLLQTPAAVRFVSYEPALEPVDFYLTRSDRQIHILESSPTFPYIRHSGRYGNKISWVIMGCESGPGARPMNLDWARSVRYQCQAAGVPFFLKQMMVNGKLVHMPELEGKVWDEFPAALRQRQEG